MTKPIARRNHWSVMNHLRNARALVRFEVGGELDGALGMESWDGVWSFAFGVSDSSTGVSFSCNCIFLSSLPISLTGTLPISSMLSFEDRSDGVAMVPCLSSTCLIKAQLCTGIPH